MPDRDSFDRAASLPAIPREPGESIVVGVEQCVEGRHVHVDGANFAVVRLVNKPGNSNACEIFFATPSGPGMYCALHRSAPQAALVDLVHGTLTLEQSGRGNPCFFPEY